MADQEDVQPPKCTDLSHESVEDADLVVHPSDSQTVVRWSALSRSMTAVSQSGLDPSSA